VSAFCDRQHTIQADIYRRFGLSFDHFGRSSSAWNHNSRNTSSSVSTQRV
jgi:methionyl-tRNA synthetase